MKQHVPNITRMAILFMVIISIALLPSCARKLTFGRSSVVPAAEGQVKIKSDNNNNYSIDVSVRNLAPSDQLTPPKNAYVVWMVTESNGTKNIGRITSSSSMLSSKLKASLKTVTTFKPVSIFITGETDPSTQYPSSMVVLNTQ